jgi:hypothetical protein
MNKHILVGLSYCIVGQLLVWVQVNAQFVWPETRRYIIPISIVGGSIVTFLFIQGTAEITKAFDGQIWPSRLIPTATGTLVFMVMTWLFLKQGLDVKGLVCITLSILILIIQLYWK